jgi:hypothetical protein
VKPLVMPFYLARVFSNAGVTRSVNEGWLVKSLAVSHAAIRLYDGRSNSLTPSSCVRWRRNGRAPPILLGCDTSLNKALLVSADTPVYQSTIDHTNWLTVLYRIQNILGSVLGPKTGCINRFLMASLISASQVPVKYHRSGNDGFIPHCFQFILP